MNINNGIEDFNNSTYKDAVILSTPNGFTSDLIQNLFKIGYRAGVSGIVHTLYDDNNRKICSAYSWIGLLMITAKTLN